MKRYILHIITFILAAYFSMDTVGAVTLPQNGGDISGTYDLTSNIKPGNVWIVRSGKTVVVNLKGYTLDGAGSKRLFHVEDGGKLTINGSGTITNGSSANGGAIYIYNGGTLILSGCTIQNSKATDNGGAIYKEGANGNVTINAGTKFISNTAGNMGGAIYATTLQINGTSTNPVVIQKNIAVTSTNLGETGHVIRGSGGGIYVPSSSILSCSIEYCHILDNYSASVGGGLFSGANTVVKNSKIMRNRAMLTESASYAKSPNSGRGGGFNFMGTDRKFELINTEVTENACMWYGGGGQLQSGAHLILNDGCTIDRNICVLKGAAGLHVTGNAIFTMNGGSISENTTYGGVGGGIHSSYGCTLNLLGGKISGNVVYGRGGGVHINTGGEIVLQGTNVDNNKAYLGTDLKYSTVSRNSDGIYSWSKPQPAPGDTDTSDTGYGGGILLDAGSCTMNAGSLSGNYAEAGGGGIGLIMLNMDNKSYFLQSRLVTFMLNGGTVKDNIAGSDTNPGNGGGVFLMRSKAKEAWDKMTSEDQASLKNQDMDKVNALLSHRPTTTINGGVISDNTAFGNGGFAYQEENTEFIVGVGTTALLSGNKANNSGGAVYIAKGAFTANGSATFIGNKAINGSGGAIYLGTGSTFLVNDAGSLNLGQTANDGNFAGTNGGGVYCQGSFTVKGISSIKYNSAASGGGVYVDGANAQFTKTATLSNNTASNGNGGAVYVTGGSITMAQNTINGNSASDNGGAIYVIGNGAKFTSTASSTIESNLTANDGGAVYILGDNAAFSVNCNTSISSNVATTGNGGAIYVQGKKASFSVTGNATVSSNSANDKGGAIYLAGEGAGFIVSGISNMESNETDGNGGAVYVDGGSVSLATNTISGNRAGNGGALYLNGGDFTASGNTTMSSNSATGNGGSVYVNTGDIEITGGSSVLTLSGNNAVNGGAFYVRNGNIKTTEIHQATITNNYSAAFNGTGGEGGAFYVSDGNISMCKTDLSGNGWNGSDVTTTNGGAIALYNGVFSFADESEIHNNAATDNGGGLYVSSETAKDIKCIGGSYLANSAAYGGGIYARGPIKLTIAANVRGNLAINGGGLYLAEGVNMTFGYEDANGVIDGLIVDNSAIASGEKGGVGGGIYVDKGTLSFYLPAEKEKQKLGIYNNAASFEAADIFSSGTSTTINLPNISGMNLTGFDVPGSALYWVKDVSSNRYQKALMNLNTDIETMILGFDKDETVKLLTEKQCLDLGYDLVYVTITPKGLNSGDIATLDLSYPTDRDNPTISNINQYRKVILQGGKNTIVGLPSGLWNFDMTSWASTYDRPTFDPEVKNGFIEVTRASLKPTNGIVTVIFGDEKDIKSYDYIKINQMIPGGSAGSGTN